jgi:hypothetical protein
MCWKHRDDMISLPKKDESGFQVRLEAVVGSGIRRGPGIVNVVNFPTV